MVTNNKKRIAEQEKLYHYYAGSQDEVLAYLDTALGITFDSDDLSEFQRNWINITKKCVNQLAIVYRDPAKRRVMVKGAENQDLTKYYNSKLPPNVNTIDKTAHRYAKLFNTSLTRIYFENGGIKYNVLPSYLFDVKVDDNDPYSLVEVSYQKDFTVNGKTERFVVVWTDAEHFKVPLLKYSGGYFTGDKQPVVEGGSTVNPYKTIPFAVCRLEEQNDFWGVGLNDLVNMNEQINVMLTELINEQIIMGTSGTTLAVNLNLKEKQKDGTVINKRVRTGRKHPIVVENVSDNDSTPRLEHVTTTPFITEIRETVDWHIKMIAMSKGLNPNSFLAEVQATSGYSKVLDAMEQLEIRRDDIEPCRMYEDERFKKSVAVNDYHETTSDKAKYELNKMGECELAVDFAEITAPKDIDEIIKDTDYKLKYDLINVYDLMRESNPDLTDKEIEEKLKANKAINDIYKPQVAPANNFNNGGLNNGSTN